MRRRRAAIAGCSAATQKRSVETTCLRRERSSRYRAMAKAVIDAKTAANWKKERFRRYMGTSLKDLDAETRRRGGKRGEHVLDFSGCFLRVSASPRQRKASRDASHA